MMYVLLVVLLTCLSAGLTQYVAFHGCPRLSVKQPFSVQRYMGKWYQKETFGTQLFQGKGRCVTASYSLDPRTGVVAVYNEQEPVSSGTARSINGTAVLEDPRMMEGKLLVTFPVPILGKITSSYWVLDTDYNSWAVVWSCVNAGGVAHAESGWILTRRRGGTEKEEKKIDEEVNSVLMRTGIPRSRFNETDQENC